MEAPHIQRHRNEQKVRNSYEMELETPDQYNMKMLKRQRNARKNDRRKAIRTDQMKEDYKNSSRLARTGQLPPKFNPPKA